MELSEAEINLIVMFTLVYTKRQQCCFRENISVLGLYILMVKWN